MTTSAGFPPRAEGKAAPGSPGERTVIPRRRRAEATRVLPARAEGVFAFETFIDDLPFASERERHRLKLAGSEIFDNLLHHAAPLDAAAMTVRVSRKGDRIFLAFYFKAAAFAPYAAACSDPELRDRDPLFDAVRRRWRGIGLKMCRNLAQSISFRAGETLDRIYLVFEPERP